MPWVKPMATRAGTPTARSMIAIADAYCSQKPCLLRRKSTSGSPLSPAGTSSEYANPFAGSVK